MRVALAQINPTVGDLKANAAKIGSYLERARQASADLVVFPEMSLCGYPPEDLLFKPDFVTATMAQLKQVVAASRGLVAVFGSIYAEGDLYNSAAVASDGSLAWVYHKQFLPNYGVFDENRYFRAGLENRVFDFGGVIFGVSVCEDIWYPDGPPEAQADLGGAQVLINVSSSPYEMGKGLQRERMLSVRASDSCAYVVYCNLVGGQDELVFDGGSLICAPDGRIVARAGQFAEELLVADLDIASVFRLRLKDTRLRKSHTQTQGRLAVVDLGRAAPKLPAQPLAPAVVPRCDPATEAKSALVLGTRDYIVKSGFSGVVLGLSGGIDSSLTAAIAAEAIGPENVTGVAMPTRYSSDHSITDAKELAKNLGMKYLEVPVDGIFQSFLDTLAPAFAGREPDVTEENIQSRIRGVVLMALSNKNGWLVLTTGNKSETGVGYSTLYGDTAGGFAVIKDVPKTLVYDICRLINQEAGRPLIPENVLTKPPSAELRPDQKDSDSLPDYDILDPILRAYVEASFSAEEIVRQGYDEKLVRRIIAMVDRNEYKRRQNPPGVKITPRSFGRDWRVPLVNRFGR